MIEDGISECRDRIDVLEDLVINLISEEQFVKHVSAYDKNLLWKFLSSRGNCESFRVFTFINTVVVTGDNSKFSKTFLDLIERLTNLGMSFRFENNSLGKGPQ